MDFNKLALELHETHQGKIEVISKIPLETLDDLSTAYTPGVAEPCRKIVENPQDIYKYTSKGNMVAVITDGTAVLGLGNIGAEASLPVMEGKCILLKEFGGVDGFPICLNVHEPEELIRTVKALAPSFGGINLEDIASPQCFEIEKRLEAELDIPVFHDDQHGTAIVVTAGLLNAAKCVGKSLDSLKVVLNGPGAAGTAIISMLLFAGVKEILACDEFGILHPDRAEGMIPHKKHLATITNLEKKTGGLAEALVGADVFIGVSAPNVLTPEMIKTMAPSPIVFAMANPVPEIPYEVAMEAGVAVMGTGRSDFPNQINNVLAFPGIFRGALRANARDINNTMKFSAAQAIAGLVSEDKLAPDYIIPSPFDPRVAEAVASAVEDAAQETGVANQRR
ncbi:MAG: malic enzyme-like NAD(P)-binding protein [Eubacteriales bacterium]